MTELSSTSTGTGTKFSTGTTCTRILVHVLVPHRLNTQVDLLNFVSLDLQLYCGTRVPWSPEFKTPPLKFGIFLFRTEGYPN